MWSSLQLWDGMKLSLELPFALQLYMQGCRTHGLGAVSAVCTQPPAVFLRVSQVCLCHLMRNSLGPSDPTTAPALPPSFPPTLPSFQECAHHIAHRQKSYSIDCKDIVSKHLASLMQIFERCTLTVPRPATTAETHVLCLLSLSDSGSKQGCSHSPASKLVFTSQGMETCHKLILMEIRGQKSTHSHVVSLCSGTMLIQSHLSMFLFCNVFPVLLLCFPGWPTFAKHPY